MSQFSGTGAALEQAGIKLGGPLAQLEGQQAAFGSARDHALHRAGWQSSNQRQYGQISGQAAKRYPAMVTALTALKQAVTAYGKAVEQNAGPLVSFGGTKAPHLRQPPVVGLTAAQQNTAAKTAEQALQHQTQAYNTAKSSAAAAAAAIEQAAQACASACNNAMAQLRAECPDVATADQLLAEVKAAQGKAAQGKIHSLMSAEFLAMRAFGGPTGTGSIPGQGNVRTTADKVMKLIPLQTLQASGAGTNAVLNGKTPTLFQDWAAGSLSLPKPPDLEHQLLNDLGNIRGWWDHLPIAAKVGIGVAIPPLGVALGAVWTATHRHTITRGLDIARHDAYHYGYSDPVTGLHKYLVKDAWDQGLKRGVWNDFMKQWVWHDGLVYGAWDQGLKRGVWNDFMKQWVWHDFAVQGVARDFAEQFVGHEVGTRVFGHYVWHDGLAKFGGAVANGWNAFTGSF